MTAEMGPRDVDLGWTERLAGRAIAPLVALFNYIVDGPTVRYRSRTATVALSGESEHPGDGFNRGILVSLLLFSNILAWLMPMLVLSDTIQQTAAGSPVFWVASALMLPVGAFSLLNLFGTMGLLMKTDVVDHTTEPAPDALDDLQQQYVDGEIDEEQLGERTAEVWER